MLQAVKDLKKKLCSFNPAKIADDVYGELGELVQDVHVTIKKNYADIKRFLDRKKKPKDDAR